MEINPNKYYTGAEVENLIKNSVAKNKRRVIENWKKGIKLGLIVGVAGTVFLTSLATMISNKINENKITKEALASYNDTEIVEIMEESEKTYRNPGQVKYATTHDNYDAAQYLVNESDNFHVDLFFAYDKVDKTSEYTDVEKKKIMDEILVRISNINDENNPNYILDYASFEDYVTKHEFVDTEGKADYEKYRAYMEQVLVNLYKVNQSELEHGLGGLNK